MKIRTQNMMAIVPLFLGLSALIGALMYVVQYRELLWGLDEEATSIAVAAARHMDAPAIRAARETEEWDAIMADPLRVLDWGRAQRIALLSPERDMLYDSAHTSGHVRPVSLTDSLEARMEERSFSATPIQQDGEGRYLMAFSPVRDDQGTAAILMVETDADALTAHEERMYRDIRRIVFVTVLIGVLLAWLISRVISRRIVSLTEAASAVGAGRYDQPHEAGGVQEINDLSSTFNTMSSVLSEVVARTRRAVVEAEQFRTDDDLACAFTETFMPPLERVTRGVAVSATHVTARSGGHFFGLFEKGAEAMAVTGAVSTSDGLQAPLAASAAAALLHECWLNQDTLGACRAWSQCCDLTTAEILIWSAGDNKVTHCVWDPVTRDFSCDASPWPDKPVIIHTITKQAAHRIHLYAQTFHHLAPHVLTEEIKHTLDKHQTGALLIVKREGV